MNIFEDMKVFIKPLGVVSPVSEININSDTVYTPYGIYEVKDVFLIFKTSLKDKNNKDIYVGDVLTDGKTEYEVLFDENNGFFLKDTSKPRFSNYFAKETRYIQSLVQNHVVIKNIYVEMQERIITDRRRKEIKKWTL